MMIERDNILININSKIWYQALEEEFKKQYFLDLLSFLKKEYTYKTIYPKEKDVFNFLNITSISDIKVVIIGQDPYHQKNQAHGLAFSVQKGIKIPPSLRNILVEMGKNIQDVESGDLTYLAEQGVFLMNTILTVEDSKPLSHVNIGWEIFTDKIIKIINKKEEPVVFLLWGNNARKKKTLITNNKHLILESTHPSPLSAYRGFFGCGHFIKTNEFLLKNDTIPIKW